MTTSDEHRGPRYLALLSLGALGVVYGDIGTSPLYAMREAFVAADGLTVTRTSVFGVLSLIFWSMTLVVSVKYLSVVMRADNDGEGGLLALTALIVPRTGLMSAAGARRGLVLLGLFGTALLYGDGIITPAISVLSAVEGAEVAAPSVEPFVVPLAVVILIGLFSIQRRGTATVGALFGPVMIVWFTVLSVLGIVQILDHPSVLGAVNPVHAVRFFGDHPALAFLALGAIFLVVTGSEALYADMGHFGKRPIRLGWFAVVLPALTLNYFGQGALVLGDPGAIDNPFYRMPPSWALVPLVVLATAATVIASQALISGAYSLTMQAVQLGYLPRVHVDHTSPRQIGQIYISAVNWTLMIACVALVLAFQSSSGLAAAYGVAVTTTMVITSILLFVVMRERWDWNPVVSAAVAGGFLVVDTAFFAANIVKIPAGGWFPLVVGGLVFVVMTTWRTGRSLVAARLNRGELTIERFIGSIAEHPQQRVPGIAVYMFSQPGAAPPALLANLRANEVLHETVVLVSVDTADTPHVARGRRATVHHLGEGFHQIVLRFGFMEEPDVPAALSEIVEADFGIDTTDVTYILGRETVIPVPHAGMSRWRARVFAALHRNSAGAAQYFCLPRDRVLEVGTQLEV